MKTAKQIIGLMISEMPYTLDQCLKPYIIEAIEIGQKESYNQAIQDAAKVLKQTTDTDFLGQVQSIIKLTKV